MSAVCETTAVIKDCIHWKAYFSTYVAYCNI